MNTGIKPKLDTPKSHKNQATLLNS